MKVLPTHSSMLKPTTLRLSMLDLRTRTGGKLNHNHGKRAAVSECSYYMNQIKGSLNTVFVHWCRFVLFLPPFVLDQKANLFHLCNY